MIQAVRIIDIANKNTTEEMPISRARVQYHCRKRNYQHVILPVNKFNQERKNKITMYLPGYVIMKKGVQENPIQLLPIPTEKAVKTRNVVWCQYWNAMRFYKLPTGFEFVKAPDPTAPKKKV